MQLLFHPAKTRSIQRPRDMKVQLQAQYSAFAAYRVLLKALLIALPHITSFTGRQIATTRLLGLLLHV
jgi:hypothetical protein